MTRLFSEGPMAMLRGRKQWREKKGASPSGERRRRTTKLLFESLEQRTLLSISNEVISSALLEAQARIAASRAAGADQALAALSDKAVHIDNAGRVQVYVDVAAVTPEVIRSLAAAGLQVEASSDAMRIVQGWVAADGLQSLTLVSGVQEVLPPAYAVTRSGDFTTEGDTIINADKVRSRFAGFAGNGNGSNVKVGVISDGASHKSVSEYSHDLPTTITVDPARPGNGDEGTAMMEVVYDIAPGAQLYFSGPTTSVEALASLDWLQQQGCQVIVDDLGFYDQPFFEDGALAQKVTNLVQGQNITYIAAAGNDALLHYQKDFSPWTTANYHDFDPSATANRDLVVKLSTLGTVSGVLQWDDPWNNSTNDYTLELYSGTSPTGPWTFVTKSPASNQTGAGSHPYEVVSANITTPTITYISWRISKATGAVARELEFFETDRITVRPTGTTFFSSADTIFGAAAVSDALTVGAVAAATPTAVETTSSQGPSTVYAPAPTNKTLRSSLDGVSLDKVTTKIGTSVYFTNPFTGTSAAAAHAAGIAALVRGTNSTVPAFSSNDSVSSIMTSTAVDIGAAGYDNLSGYGRFDAMEATYRAFKPPIVEFATNLTSAPTFVGSAPQGSFVRLYVDDVLMASKLLAAGVSKYLITIPKLSAGTHNITVRMASSATATAISYASDPYAVTIPAGAGWEALGPALEANGQTPGTRPVTGRVTALAADPTDVNVFYVGTAGGGVWKTFDNGNSFVPLTDQYVGVTGDSATLVVGAMALARSNPKILYVGTGEANQTADSLYGRGILKSIDGGYNWTQLATTYFDRASISKLVVDPNNPDIVYAAVVKPGDNASAAYNSGGIWRSDDGGVTWINTTRSVGVLSEQSEFTDLVMDPTNSQILYAAVGSDLPGGDPNNGLWKSNNAGTTWVRCGNFWDGGANPQMARISLAIAPSAPSVLYAMVATNTGGQFAFFGSTDSGTTWSTKNPPINILVNRGLNANTLIVDPLDSTKVYAGGTILARSTNSASAFTDITYGSTDNVNNNLPGPHYVIHAFAFNAAGGLLVGTDGGVWRLAEAAVNPMRSWIDSNGLAPYALNATSVNSIAIDASNPSVLYAGTQGNATAQYGLPQLMRTYTVRNTSATTPLVLGSVTVPNGFTVIKQPSSPVLPGGTTAFTVQFTAATAALYSGTASIATLNGPYTFAMRGTVDPTESAEVAVEGLGQNIAVGATAFGSTDGTDFGAVLQNSAAPTRTFTVWNTGGLPLTTANFSLPAGFSVVGAGLDALIQPGRGSTFTLRLDTTTTGLRQGLVSFTHNGGSNTDGTESPFTFTISGQVSTSSLTNVSVTGKGQNIAHYDMLPSPADDTDFGAIPLNYATAVTRTYTVRNTGASAITLGSATVSDSHYTITKALAATLAPGASDTLTVRLLSATAGTYPAIIAIPCNDGVNGVSSYTFAILGAVASNYSAASPEIAVEGLGRNIATGRTLAVDLDGSNFGSVALNAAPVTRTFTVWNTGTAALSITSATVPAGYTVTKALGTSIAAGASDTLSVRLNTATGGTFTGDITINNNGADYDGTGTVDPAETAFKIRILGIVDAPKMSVESSAGTPIAMADALPSPADSTDFGAFAVNPWKGVDNTGSAAVGASFDAGTTLINPTNSLNIYHVSPFTGNTRSSFLRRSLDGGASWATIVSGIAFATDAGNALPPLAMDPGNGQHLFVATDKIYESSNGGTLWSPVPLDGNWPVNTPVDALTVSDGGNVIVASLVSAAQGSQIWVTTDHGASWTVWRPSAFTIYRMPWTSLLIDPSSPNIMYAATPTFSDTNAGMRVMRSTNSGLTWTSIGGTLPDIPCRALEMVANGFGTTDDVLYVGNDLGVYKSVDLGTTWTRTGNGLPNVSVRDLEFNATRHALYVATAGRGVWDIPVHVLSPIDFSFLPPNVTGPGRPAAAVEGTTWGDPTPIFSFTDSNPNATADDYTALVTWGDGTTSTITSTASVDGQIVARANGGYDVLGKHLYTEHYTGVLFQVQVYNSVAQTGASDPNFNVADAPLTAGDFATLTGVVEGVQLFDQFLFHFTDGNSYGNATDFSALIDWGDGSTFTATSQTAPGSRQTPLVNGGRIAASPGGGFDVFGSHLYVDSIASTNVSVAVTDIGGETANGISAALNVSEAQLTPGLAWYPYAHVGQAFSQQLVFTFTDANTYSSEISPPFSEGYKATIYWGDNTSSVVTASPSAEGQISRRVGTTNEYQVRGSHTYSGLVTNGTFQVVVEDDGSLCTSAPVLFSLGTPQLTLGNLTLPAAVERVPFVNQPLLRIADNIPSAAASDYTADITWGDGTTSTVNSTLSADGQIVAVDSNDPGAGFFVLGSHTYARQLQGATFSITVHTDNTLPRTATATTSSFRVSDAPLLAGSLTPPAAVVEGTPVADSVLFHFDEAYPDLSGQSLADYKATITWGDGTFSTVTSVPSADGYLVANPGGGFDVHGMHLYRQSLKNATFSVRAVDVVEAAQGSVNTFNVAEALLTAGALTPPVAVAGVPFNNLLLFHFSDANSYSTPADFVATINWGDGTTVVTSAPLAAGQIVTNPNGGFDVLGSHTYAASITNGTFSVQVDDDSMSTGASTNTLNVGAGSVDATGGYVVQAKRGVTFVDQIVATFTNPGGEPPANYAASINWADGSESLGAITYDSGTQVYTVTGSHTYAANTPDASLRIFVTISHGPATPVTVASSVVLQDGFTPGLYDPQSSLFYLRNSNSEGPPDTVFPYGVPGAGWKPVAGDWDGNGTYTIGLYDPSTSLFYLRNSNSTGPADISFGYGDPAAGNRYALVMGDWNGDGVTTVGLYDRLTGQWYLRNSNSAGYADISFGYGQAGSNWTPLVGDWDGDGISTVGFYDTQNAVYYLRNSNTTGYADYTFGYGQPGSAWTPVMGDWDNNHTATIGFYDQASSHWFLRNSNTVGVSDIDFGFGSPGANWLPIVGNWVGTTAAPLLAAGALPSTAAAPLAQSQLQPIVATAIARWAEQGLSADTLNVMRQAQVVVADLNGVRLGETLPGTIRIDLDAAGHGWFVDATPADDTEFVAGRAVSAQAIDRIDLLTVVEHELGHLAGLKDLELSTESLMDATLVAGVRRLPGQAEADALFGGNNW